MSANPYDRAFYLDQAPGSRMAANVIIGHLTAWFEPTSVLDLGCGVGTWVAEWMSRGVEDAIGVDREYVDRSLLQIPPDHFELGDLRKPIDLGRRFDLAECLEVAEHIGERYADVIVGSLVRHADTILFSAAPPGQGGPELLNEQWPSYWITKFNTHGYTAYDLIRPHVWTDARLNSWWYRQNTFLLAKGRDYGPSGVLDAAHPLPYNAHRFPLTPKQLARLLARRTVDLARVRVGLEPKAWVDPSFQRHWE
jgi:SAM-dependent methyltransferase